MLRTLAKRISTIGNALRLLAPDEIDDRFLDEKNLYKRDIITAALNLQLFEEDLVTSSVISRELDKITFLAYAGGIAAGKCAAGYIPTMVQIMERSDLRNDVRVAILRAVSVIALNHPDNQAICFEEGMFTMVSDIIVTSNDNLQLWAIYALYCMVFDNIPYLQLLKEQREVCTAVREATGHNWLGFKHNYAHLILKVAGIERVRLTKSSLTKPTTSTKSSNLQSPTKL